MKMVNAAVGPKNGVDASAASVIATLAYTITRCALPGMKRSSTVSTTWPPSRGRIGTRLNSPMIGPAHHTAWRGAVSMMVVVVERVGAHRHQHEAPAGDVGRAGRPARCRSSTAG